MTNVEKATWPSTTPLFPLAGALLLPGGRLPLNVFEPRYLQMVDDALGGPRMISMIQPLDGESVGVAPPLYGVGCAGRIVSFAETGDGRYLITLAGLRRFRLVKEVNADTPYRMAEVDWRAFAIDVQEDSSGARVDREKLISITEAYLDAEGLQADRDAAKTAPIENLVVSLAMGCPFAPAEKQALLEAETLFDRAECLIALMEMAGANEPGDQHLQ